MYTNLAYIDDKIYTQLGFNINSIQVDSESVKYEACTFKLNDLHIAFRTAKITPTKTGQFVTIWKRSELGPIEPYHQDDIIDYVFIHVKKDHEHGQFIFPKSVLIAKGIFSTDYKDGKRGFRVYPSWDKTTNTQAIKTQKWQLNYFFKYSKELDLKIVQDLLTRQ
ncbi:hypothetical protein JCM19298_1307 [Nonlabens ulvanivorans]|nr:MepB family protein [Nonlabens ulvanivorans]GAK95178.1 hypothetical protein JCM19298_1307 [Nonlabens ulvanivorans]